MKRISIIFSALLFILLGSVQCSEISWDFTKNYGFLSYTAEFDCRNEDFSEGKIVRTGLFTPRYYYDFFDAKGTFQARGITRAFSLGMIASWGTEIDVYDQGGNFIGSIHGEFFTRSRAKFSFYDGNGQWLGAAYLNNKSSDFIISCGTHPSVVVGKLSGNVCGDASAWRMSLQPKFLSIDERLLKIFGAFVADFDQDFVAPPEILVFYFSQEG